MRHWTVAEDAQRTIVAVFETGDEVMEGLSLLTEAPGHLSKTFRPEVGLALIDLGS
jgi:hypothetical protein